MPTSSHIDGESFSFRWSVTVPAGAGRGQILYDFMLKTYAALGLTPLEFALLLHLSAYHYDTSYGRSQPSLVTIAAEMGRKTRSVRRLIASLQAKGLLQITPAPGNPNIYDAQPFAERALALWKTNPGQKRPRSKTSAPPRTKMSAETREYNHKAPPPTYRINPRWREIRRLLAEEAIIDPHSPTQRNHLTELMILCDSYEAWTEAARRAKSRDPNAGLDLVEHILRQAVNEGCFDHTGHDRRQWAGILYPDPRALARAEADQAAGAAGQGRPREGEA